VQTTTTTTSSVLDRNHDGRIDMNDLTGRPASNIHHNPLDRNHDGRVDLNDLTGRQTLAQQETLIAGQTAYVQSARRASLVRAEPTIMETIQKEVVIHERIHPVQKEEIQPVIYREREQLDVRQVTQMMHETQIQPTLIQQRELPAERREAIVERGAPIAENFIAASREVDVTLRTQVVHAPIVNEVIKKTIIEEIQPVLERDIITSTVIQNTQPIYEKIVEAPLVTRETVIVHHDRGLVGGSLEALTAQGFNIGEAGQRLSQTYTTTQISGALNGQNVMTSQNTYVNTVGNRRSLAEALPVSYNYLAAGQDVKLAEQAALGNNYNAALPTKAVL